MDEKFLPGLMIVLSISSAIIYFWTGDYRRGIYWLASAVIVASVTL